MTLYYIPVRAFRVYPVLSLNAAENAIRAGACDRCTCEKRGIVKCHRNPTVTPEQDKHRKAFIDECRQKAWGAACHADWISKGVDDVMAHYQKLQAEDRAFEEAIKAADNAIDYHTVENRNKRKSMQERRNTLASQMKVIGENARQGQQSLQQLYASMESNLALAKHAEEWEWKEAGSGA